MSDLDLSNHSVPLPPVLDLTAAAPLTERLLSLRGHDLTLDASAVTRVGAQCLQVLLSAVSTWNDDGARIDFVNPSSEFTEALVHLGIDPDKLTSREITQ